MTTRKSTKRLKLKVKFEKYNNLYCLVFSLNKPNYSIIFGSNDFTSLESSKEITNKVPSIFYNAIRDYVYILEEEVLEELNKLKRQYILDKKVK